MFFTIYIRNLFHSQGTQIFSVPSRCFMVLALTFRSRTHLEGSLQFSGLEVQDPGAGRPSVWGTSWCAVFSLCCHMTGSNGLSPVPSQKGPDPIPREGHLLVPSPWGSVFRMHILERNTHAGSRHLEAFACVPDIMNFTLLRAGSCCISSNNLGFVLRCSHIVGLDWLI